MEVSNDNSNHMHNNGNDNTLIKYNEVLIDIEEHIYTTYDANNNQEYFWKYRDTTRLSHLHYIGYNIEKEYMQLNKNMKNIIIVLLFVIFMVIGYIFNIMLHISLLMLIVFGFIEQHYVMLIDEKIINISKIVSFISFSIKYNNINVDDLKIIDLINKLASNDSLLIINNPLQYTEMLLIIKMLSYNIYDNTKHYRTTKKIVYELSKNSILTRYNNYDNNIYANLFDWCCIQTSEMFFPH
jgi:hypothetical protein